MTGRVLILLLSCSSIFVSGREIKADYDTIVVGLGAAGVTAASTLATAGKRVLGLEAQDRIGGRVKTVPFSDGIVEEGAEWIHGTNGSKTYNLAVQNNIILLEQAPDTGVYRSDGSIADTELILELVQFCLELRHEAPKDPEPVGKYITRRLTDYLKEKHPHLLRNQDFVDGFLEAMNLVINTFIGSSDWNDVTVTSQYKELAGNQDTSWHRHGYMTFFEILLNTYNNGPGLPTLDIKLNKEVTLIKWPKNSTGVVEVTCKDGDRYTANNVIVTVSLGVLKERYSTLFIPELPQEKITVIENMSFGIVGKIILSFPEAWWGSTNVTGYLFIWQNADKDAVEDSEKWILKVGTASLPMGSNRTITLWVNGDVHKMVETLPEDVVRNASVKLLRRFLGKHFTIPEPTGIIRSTWYSNPFTRGAYSYDNLWVAQHPNARSTLSEPLVDYFGIPKILFAGEATNSIHFSTVHGASDSGYTEAMRLLPSNNA